MGALGVLGAATAQAQPAPAALHYTCTFPTIGGQQISADLATDIPTSLPVGASSPPFAINAHATVDGSFTLGLHYVLGVSNLEGSIDTEADVTAPEGPISVPVHLVIPRTGVPSSGSFSIPARGLAPSLTFHEPGAGRVSAGDFTLHLVPEDANGHVTYPGKVDVPCTLNSGQNNVVGLFQITSTAPTTGPATSPPSGGTTATSISSSGSPSAKSSSAPPSAGTTVATGPSDSTTPRPTSSALQAATTAATKTAHDSATGPVLLVAGVLAIGTAIAVAARRYRRR
jgi:hypothetical protein